MMLILPVNHQINDRIIEFIEVNIEPKFIVLKKIHALLTETFGLKAIYVIFSIMLSIILYCGITALLKRKYDVFLTVTIAFFIVLGFMLTLLGL
ncbi:MAG: hypothetical protein PWP45_821 [Tepidanaerobacteraceae bacterium]|nr:hypothetical protein [Tepidanaerobacteraceae bacterium]